MNTIILIIFLLMPNTVKNLQKKALKLNRMEIIQDTSYDYSIKIIKKWEKFSPKRYELFGKTYIGYGHLLNKKDTISILNEFEANSILKIDFQKSFAYMHKICPKMQKNRKLVLSMFIFNCGIGKFKKSKLLKLIKHGSNDSVIENQYFNHVFANGKYIPKLKLRRNDEFKIWKL